MAAIASHHAWLSSLEEELLRARDIEGLGKSTLTRKKNELHGSTPKTCATLWRSDYSVPFASRTNFKPTMCDCLKRKFAKLMKNVKAE